MKERCNRELIGVDGCKYGWVAVSLKSISANLFRSITELVDFFPDNSIFLIDMPIGLASAEQLERDCETIVRKSLSPKRKSSLFPVPCREAVYAKSYEDANLLNKRIIKKGVSKQSWGIIPKIKEVDQLLQNDKSLINKIKESHPEVAFHFLNNQQSMVYHKKLESGNQERLQVLNNYTDKAEVILKNTLTNFKRKDVSADDIVDAICLAVTLEQMVKCNIPFENGNLDGKGIPMKIHYAKV